MVYPQGAFQLKIVQVIHNFPYFALVLGIGSPWFLSVDSAMTAMYRFSIDALEKNLKILGARGWIGDGSWLVMANNSYQWYETHETDLNVFKWDIWTYDYGKMTI